jgi:tellurite resistance protein TerC
MSAAVERKRPPEARCRPEGIPVHVSTTAWCVTIAVTLAVLAFDVVIIGRRPHEPSARECAVAISLYTSLAMLFGLWIWLQYGQRYAGEFFAGWLTEYSLSVDNLFIFIIIMSRFAVPRRYQQEALMIGIVLALVFRGAFIALGAVAINQISWVFYIFGVFLLYTAWSLARHGTGGDQDYQENRSIRWVRKHLPATEEYDGVRLTTKVHGSRLITPMLVVIIALGSTDILFALDSIPAIYGLTEEPYLVLSANIFALMGLRQLYFLLGGLLRRLVYLSFGLSVILAFIGVKLVLHALHENRLPFVNGGRHVAVPEVPTWLSLLVIVGTLAVTAVTSLIKTGLDASDPSSA